MRAHDQHQFSSLQMSLEYIKFNNFQFDCQRSDRLKNHKLEHINLYQNHHNSYQDNQAHIVLSSDHHKGKNQSKGSSIYVLNYGRND